MEEGRLLKNLELTSVFRNAQNDEEESQLLYHLYIILKPNEDRVNSTTRRVLQMIEELVPDKTESNLHGDALGEKICMTKFGFTNGQLHRLDDCDEKPTSMQDVINDTFPHFLCISFELPDTDDSSDIEFGISDLLSSKDKNLPIPLHLMSCLKIPLSTSSSEILRLCCTSRHKRSKQGENNIFDEGPHKPIQPCVPSPTKDACLKPKVSLIYVKNYADAMSDALRAKCLETPICVIRDLAHAVGISLELFTTKQIEMIAQDYEIDLREQWNVSLKHSAGDSKSWFYPSFRYRTKVAKYSTYQGDMFAYAIKDGYSILKRRQDADENANTSATSISELNSARQLPKKRKRSNLSAKKNRIFFGTNLDFSGAAFKDQILELQKLPSFCKMIDETNFLSHLGYDLKGMNTAQFYMKIPGSRTPAHLENNSFCSVNLNIGPGDCEWFGVSYEFYPQIDQMKKLDFLNSSWWPDYDELIAAGIPVYRFMQKTGDIVWISGGCIHWVEAKGWCNNVAWNVGPMCPEQYKLNLLSTEFNRAQKFESLIPMQYLSWNVAKNCHIKNPQLRDLIRATLIRSLAHTQLVLDYVKMDLNKKVEFVNKELAQTTTNCTKCRSEIFNILFAQLSAQGNELDRAYETYCLYCAKDIGFESIEVWQVYKIKYLCEILDQF